MRDDILDENLEPEKPLSIENLEFGSFFQRIFAFFLDLIVVLPIGFLLYLCISYLRNIPFALITTVLYFLYKPYMEYRHGASFGKEIFKLKVVDKDNQKTGLVKVLIRNLLWLLLGVMILSIFTFFYYLDLRGPDLANHAISERFMGWLEILGVYIVFPLGLLSPFFILFTKNNQSLTDLIAKTYCVKND